MQLNQRAIQIIQEKVLPYQKELGVEHVEYCGVHLIDMGVHVPGSWQAGLLFTEISLCGFGKVNLRTLDVGGYLIPHVEVFVDHAEIAELSSHVAFWRVIDELGNEMNFSGPVRSVVRDQYSNAVEYEEKSKQVVLCLQLDEFPSQLVMKALLAKTNVNPNDIYLIIAPTASIVGALQVPARNVEQVLPTLLDKGFDVGKIKHACGITPIIAMVDDEMEAYGRVNDCLIYGQVTNLYVECDDEEITKMQETLTMDQELNDEIYGTPFKEIFAKCGNDWCNVPRNWDAPCSVVFHNLSSGNVFRIGTQNQKVLLEGFFGTQGECYDK